MQLEDEVHIRADCKPPGWVIAFVHVKSQIYIEAAVQRAANSAQ